MAWWLTPLIPAPRRQIEVDLCESEASLVYILSSRTAMVMQGDLVSKQNRTSKIKEPKVSLFTLMYKRGYVTKPDQSQLSMPIVINN